MNKSIRTEFSEMTSTAYTHFFEAQKKMFEEWQDQLKKGFEGFTPAQAAGAAPAEHLQKFFETAQDFWKKIGDSTKSYHAVFELWKQLSEKNAALTPEAVSDMYEAWQKQHFGLIRESLIPTLPAYAKDLTEKYMANMESCCEVMGQHGRKWFGNETSLKQAFYKAMADGPRGYIDFLDVWQRNYEETFGKMMKAPTFGKDMDFWQRQKSSFDRFVKYNAASAKFYASLVDIAEGASRQVIEDYAAMQKQGTQPKTFDDFYKYWAKTVSKAYDKVLFSEEISVLAGNMVNEMSKFKIEYDKLCEMYLTSVPVPKKSDMDDLYKTVHDLKLELRALKKEMKSNAKAEK